MKAESWKTPESICLSCGYSLDGATGIDGHSPRAGDISICLYCGHLQTYDADLKLCNLTDEQMLEVAGDKNVLRAQELAAQFRKEHPNRGHRK
jgi:hypothetical protein